MATIKAGIRELKTRLSAYIRIIESGSTVVITERGKPVGKITTIQPSIDARIQELTESGLVRWNGRKFAPQRPLIKPRQGKIGDLVLEDRE
jgi:prevent-host-death family protein